MKTLLLFVFSFSIALAQVVSAEDQDEVKQPKTRSNVQAPKKVAPKQVSTRPVGPSQTPTSKVPHINQAKGPANQYQPKGQYPAGVYPNPTTYDVGPKRPPIVQPNGDGQRNAWQEQRRQNTTPQNHNQDWQNRHSNATWNNNSWEEARRRHQRHHHHRDWWRSRYSRFALFGSGYYFWDSGYWFPAYGYDPAYNTYAYDEPIYGYNDLDPAQVIANVQTELQRLGYFRYAVDGWMGPMTRAAIANYQRDNGLAITSAIDGPTLQSLGLE
jgi:hypothetical protein